MKIVTDTDALTLVNALPTDNLLSVKQVAASIGRSDQYVRGLCDIGEENGGLKVLGGRPDKSKQYILIYRTSVVRYIERNTK